MGRPIKQKFFDPRPDTPADGSSRILIGGEAVSSLSFSNRGAGYYSANVAITLGAPNLPTGTQATVSSITLFGNGAINTFSIVGGAGYTTAPSVTITGANATPAVATSTLVSNAVTNVIATSAFIPAADGGSSAVIGDIVKQVGARRYKVRTAQGIGVCTLSNAAPTAGKMTITATDSASGTYYVTKLTSRVATLESIDGTEFEDGKKVRWTLGSAVLNTTVSIANN
jgi:hypothetical protein